MKPHLAYEDPLKSNEITDLSDLVHNIRWIESSKQHKDERMTLTFQALDPKQLRSIAQPFIQADRPILFTYGAGSDTPGQPKLKAFFHLPSLDHDDNENDDFILLVGIGPILRETF